MNAAEQPDVRHGRPQIEADRLRLGGLRRARRSLREALGDHRPGASSEAQISLRAELRIDLKDEGPGNTELRCERACRRQANTGTQ